MQIGKILTLMSLNIVPFPVLVFVRKAQSRLCRTCRHRRGTCTGRIAIGTTSTVVCSIQCQTVKFRFPKSGIDEIMDMAKP
jgi:hypothetical protein